MARYPFHGTYKDGEGKIVPSGTISVYLAGTSTAASIYVASAGGSAVNSVTSNATTGAFIFYIDDGDYGGTQRFKITLSKTNYILQSYDDITILPFTAAVTSIDSIATKYVDDLFDGGYDVFIKPSYIFGGGTNTAGHTVPNVADDTFVLLAATQTMTNKTLTSPVINTPTGDVVTKTGTQTLTNKTLTTPTIASFINAAHDHADAAGGGLVTTVTGAFVQSVYVESGAHSTGTTIFPHDNTTPQNTEGDLYLTAPAITPKSTSNYLVLEAVLHGSVGLAAWLGAGIFRDSVTDAVVSTDIYINVNGGGGLLILRKRFLAPSTSAIVFKVRMGMEIAGTTTFNGAGIGAVHSGKLASSLRITEEQG